MGGSHARLDRNGILKVYIRHPEDLELVRQTLESDAPAETPRIYLQGDICRGNLLTEIDGMVYCSST
jgi:chorismate lyase/3-hydroxybenzoate synthase